MRDDQKTKSQLIAELNDLRKYVKELEGLKTNPDNGENIGQVILENKDRFHSILENINDLVYRYEFTPKRGFTYVSPSAHQITGYTPEEHYADPDLGFKLVHPDDRHILEEQIKKGGDFQKPVALRWIKKDGSVIWTEQRNSPVFDDEGNLVAIEGIARDITERKHAEARLQESEASLARAQQISHLGNWSWDVKNNSLCWSDEVYNIFKFNKETELTYDGIVNRIHPDDRDKNQNFVNQLLETAGKSEVEFRIILPDGAERYIYQNAEVMKNDSGEVFKIFGIMHDITERKQAEEELAKSETKYRQLVNSLNEGIWEIDAQGNTTFVNPRMAQMLGYRVEEMEGKHLFAFMDDEWVEVAKDKLEQRSQGKAEQHEFTFRKKNGDEVYTLVNTTAKFNDEGNYAGALAGVADITVSKLTEKALIESEKKYRDIFENAPIGIFRTNSHGQALMMNDFMANILDFGSSAEAIEHYHDLGSQLYALAERRDEFIRCIQENGFVEDFEYEAQLVSGRRVWLNMNARIVDWIDDKLFEIEGFTTDVSERKKAEEELSHSERFLNDLFDAIQDGISVLNSDLNVVKTNVWMQKMYAHQMPLVGQKCYKVYQQRKSPCSKCPTLHTLETGNVTNFTVAYPSADHPKGWLSLTAFPIRDDEGKITNIIEYVKDITDQKNAEEALRESEERLKLALEVTKLGTWEWDLRSNDVKVNERWAEMKGYTLEEIEPHLPEWTKFVHPDDLPKVMDTVFAHFKREIPIAEAEFRFKHKSGKWIWIMDRGKVIEWDEKGEPLKAIGTHFDLTERKVTEEKLRASEERYKKLSNLTFEGVFFHKGGIVRDVNDSFTRITGYSQGEIVGKNILQVFVPPEYHGIVREKILKRVATPYEIEIRNKDGRRIPVEIEARKVQEYGNEYRVAAIRDITDRKKTEEELRISRRNFQLFVNSSPDLFFLKDLSLRYLVSNDANSAFFNKTESEILGKTDFDLMPPEAAENCRKTDMMAIEQKKTIIDTETVGDRIYETRKIPVYDHEKIIGVAGFIRDITERIKAEQQLHLQSLVLNQIRDRVTITDLNGIITYVNEAEVHALKYPREELIGKSTSKYGDDAAQGATQQEILEKTLEHGYWRGEVVNYTADGRAVILDTRTMAVHDENGETIALCGISTDITERKKIEEELRENEEKFRLLAENSVDCIWTMDKKLRFTYLSPALEHMTGFKPKEWVGTHLSSHFRKIEFLKVGKLAARAIKNYKTFTHVTFETKMLDKKNEEVDFEISSKILLNADGKLIGLQGTTRDITERKIAEKKLEYRLKLEQLISDISTRFVGVDAKNLDKEIQRTLQRIGKFTRVDRICIFMFSDSGDFANLTREWRMRGIPSVKSKLQKIPVSEFPWIVDKLRRSDTVHIPRVEDVPKDAKPEKQLMQAHGIKSLLMVNLACGRELLGFIGFDNVREERTWEKEDISLIRTIGEIFAYKFENRRFEQEREQLLHNLGERLKEMKLLYQVSQYSTDLEKSLDEFLTNTVNEIPTAWHYPELTCARIILNGKEYRTKDFKKTKWRISQDIHLHGRKAGSIEVCLLKNITMPDERPFLEEELNLIKSIATQIMSFAERKQAEAQIRDVNEKLKRIFDASRSAIIMVDAEGKITEWNRASEEIFGWKAEEVVGNFNPTVPENLMDFYCDTIRNKVNNIEVRVNHKDNKMVDLLLSNTPLFDENKKFIGSVSVMSDISDLKRAEKEKDMLEKQLRRSQKMETIGTLAGGIAHDFNNILTPIMGYTDMAIATLPQDDSLKEDLKHVLKGAHRAKELVQQILAFSRQIEQERKPIKLHLIVKEAIQLLRPSIPSTIEIRQRIDTTCAPVLADASQIHQVIVNLCTNANHAIGDAQGCMNIELTQIEVDEKTATLNPNLEPKEYVRLTVEDTGIGMDAETVERIFDPFFTTKDVDKGTGLGLSVVHGIVRSHHGDVHVQSEPGKGTTFHVFLPVAVQSRETAMSNDSQAIHGGKENIMVVDDEQMVANVVKKMLAHHGYHVDMFDNSQSALRIFRKDPEKYDLIISDLTMPELNGLEFAKKVQHMRPDLPFILMTGYGENVSDEVLNRFNIEEIIAKPIDRKVLAAAVRRAVEKS